MYEVGTMRVAVLSAILALAGCSTVYIHDTKSASDFDVDSYECEKDAAPVLNMLRAEIMFEKCMRLKGWVPEAGSSPQKKSNHPSYQP